MNEDEVLRLLNLIVLITIKQNVNSLIVFKGKNLDLGE